MSLVTRRRVLAAALAGGVGLWQLTSTDEVSETTVSETGNTIIYSDSPLVFTGTDTATAGPITIESATATVTVATASSESPQAETLVQLYHTSTGTQQELLSPSATETASIHSLPSGEYDLYIRGNTDQWRVELYPFSTPVSSVLRPPLRVSDTGDTVVGPIQFPADIPLQFKLTDTQSTASDPSVGLYSLDGTRRKRIFSETTDAGTTTYHQREHVGGIGFLQITADTSWRLNVTPVETLTQ
jgi:hypothetical protein